MARSPSTLEPRADAEQRERRSGAAGRVPALVFAPEACELPAVELCLNFGLLAGREATAAEIEQLAGELLMRVAHVSITAERRYEFGALAAAAVHQLRIRVPLGALPAGAYDLLELRGRVMEISERWLEACLAARTRELEVA